MLVGEVDSLATNSSNRRSGFLNSWHGSNAIIRSPTIKNGAVLANFKVQAIVTSTLYSNSISLSKGKRQLKSNV